MINTYLFMPVEMIYLLKKSSTDEKNKLYCWYIYKNKIGCNRWTESVMEKCDNFLEGGISSKKGYICFKSLEYVYII